MTSKSPNSRKQKSLPEDKDREQSSSQQGTQKNVANIRKKKNTMTASRTRPSVRRNISLPSSKQGTRSNKPRRKSHSPKPSIQRTSSSTPKASPTTLTKSKQRRPPTLSPKRTPENKHKEIVSRRTTTKSESPVGDRKKLPPQPSNDRVPRTTVKSESPVGERKKLPPQPSNNRVDDDDELLLRGDVHRKSTASGDRITPRRNCLEDSEVYGFEDDTMLLRLCRYLRILPPHPDEHPIKRRVRIFLWWTLIVDFVVALVSILSFGGEVTKCCGDPVFSIRGEDDWSEAIKIISYIYMVGVIVEIYPVIRDGPIPWNLLNPIFGFIISFFVFVDDSPVEAVSLWILEVVTVVLEVLTYRQYVKLYKEGQVFLSSLDTQLSENVEKGYRRHTLYRKRKELREGQAKDLRRIQKHLIGVTINVVLVCVSLLLIVFVARSRGMCVYDGKAPNIFDSNAAFLCDACKGKSCQVCDTEITQCYFEYF